MDDPLTRFVTAQDRDGSYDRALAELRAGDKRTHWMWFVLPQLAGLGRSPMAELYGIDGLEEARDYLRHPVLGPRLRECAHALLGARGSAEAVLGLTDALKLRSCMTLFLRASPTEELWQQVLDRFHGGAVDPETDKRLGHKGRLLMGQELADALGVSPAVAHAMVKHQRLDGVETASGEFGAYERDVQGFLASHHPDLTSG